MYTGTRFTGVLQGTKGQLSGRSSICELSQPTNSLVWIIIEDLNRRLQNNKLDIKILNETNFCVNIFDKSKKVDISRFKIKVLKDIYIKKIIDRMVFLILIL